MPSTTALGLTKFQFQSGAVKSKVSNNNTALYIAFQFQSGAVKSFDSEDYGKQERDFNSKVVRLKAS